MDYKINDKWEVPTGPEYGIYHIPKLIAEHTARDAADKNHPLGEYCSKRHKDNAYQIARVAAERYVKIIAYKDKMLDEMKD